MDAFYFLIATPIFQFLISPFCFFDNPFFDTPCVLGVVCESFVSSVYTLIVICVGESKVPPVLYWTYSTVLSSACLYSTAVEITQAGSHATLLERSASTIIVKACYVIIAESTFHGVPQTCIFWQHFVLDIVDEQRVPDIVKRIVSSLDRIDAYISL